MKDCEKIELLISMDIDNELTENEKIFLEKHLESCDKCRRKKEEFLKLKKAFNSNLRIKKPVSINLKRIFVPAIAALILIISGIVFSIYYNNGKNINYVNRVDYPLSSYFLEESKTYNYYEPMSSYVMYSYNEE